MREAKKSSADVFFATPITAPLRDLSRPASVEYRETLKSALAVLRSCTFGRVFLALEEEGWEDVMVSAAETARRDYAEVSRADAMVALYPNRGTSSVLVELGWAAALKKPILIAVERPAEMVPLVRGLSAVTRVVIAQVWDFASLCSVLEMEASAFLASVRPAS